MDNNKQGLENGTGVQSESAVSTKTQKPRTTSIFVFAYLTTPEKLFLGFNMIVLVLMIVGVIRGLIVGHVVFGMVDSIMLYAIIQSVYSLRYQGLRRIPREKFNERIEKDLINTERVQKMFGGLKGAIYLWIGVIVLYIFFTIFFTVLRIL